MLINTYIQVLILFDGNRLVALYYYYLNVMHSDIHFRTKQFSMNVRDIQEVIWGKGGGSVVLQESYILCMSDTIKFAN